MKFQFLNKAQFVHNLDNNVNGVYIFELDSCTVCDRYNSLLKDVDTSHRIFRIDCDEDLDYYMSLGLNQMPETRLYLSGEFVKSVKGIPTQSEISEIFDAKD